MSINKPTSRALLLILALISTSAMCSSPPIFVNVPGPQMVREDLVLDLTSNGMSVFDTSLGSNLLRMRVTCSNGNVTITIPGGVTSNGNSIVFDGTISTVSTALNTLKYQGNLHYKSLSPNADSITLNALDLGDSLNATASIPITVTPFDYPPTIAAPANQIVPRGTAVGPLAFTVGDIENAGDIPFLNVAATSSNAAITTNGNIIIARPGPNMRTVSFTPFPGVSGTTTITLTVTDSSNQMTSASFTVTIDDPPTISVLNNLSGPEGTPLSQAFTIGDTEDNPSTLLVSATSSNQTLVPNSNISITGTGPTPMITLNPVLFQSGTTTITVTVKDSAGLTSNGNFNANFAFVNHAPVLDPTAVQVLNPIGTNGIPSNGTLVSSIMAGAITDVDPGAFHGIAVTFTDNSNGTWKFTTDGGTNWNTLNVASSSVATTLSTNANTSIRFVPATDGNYLATILFRAWDQTDLSANGSTNVNASVGGGSSAFSSVETPTTVSVTHVNVAPTFTIPAPSNVVVPVNAPAQLISNFITNITFGAAIETSQTVSLVVTSNSNAALFLVPPQFIVTGNTATLAFLLAPNKSGTAYLAIVAKDNGGTQFGGQDTSPPQFITISTNLLLPVARNSQLTVTEDVVTTGALLASDPQRLPLTYSIVSNGTLGTATIPNSSLGIFSYAPKLHVSGTDQITFKVNNGYIDSNIATVTIFIVPVNYPPTVVSISATPNPAGISETVTFFAAGTDIEDGTHLTYAWNFGDGASGTGSSATHAYAAAGVYKAVVTITDTGGASTTGSVTVTVGATTYGTGPDTNGDGVSDALEQAILALNPNANPVPSTPPQILHVDTLTIKLNFAKKNSDTLALGGVLPGLQSLSFQGQIVALDVGGVVLAFKLDQKLKAKTANGTVALGVDKRFRGMRYALKLKGSFAAPLAAFGLTNAAATNTAVTVPMTILFGSSGYVYTASMKYTARAGKTGSATLK